MFFIMALARIYKIETIIHMLCYEVASLKGILPHTHHTHTHAYTRTHTPPLITPWP